MILYGTRVSCGIMWLDGTMVAPLWIPLERLLEAVYVALAHISYISEQETLHILPWFRWRVVLGWLLMLIHGLWVRIRPCAFYAALVLWGWSKSEIIRMWTRPAFFDANKVWKHGWLQGMPWDYGHVHWLLPSILWQYIQYTNFSMVLEIINLHCMAQVPYFGLRLT